MEVGEEWLRRLTWRGGWLGRLQRARRMARSLTEHGGWQGRSLEGSYGVEDEWNCDGGYNGMEIGENLEVGKLVSEA